MELLEHYIYLLKKHDWYWRQSDDTRFVEKNIRVETEINKLQKELDVNAVLYNKYSPFFKPQKTKQ